MDSKRLILLFLVPSIFIFLLTACIRSTGSDTEPWQPNQSALPIPTENPQLSNPYITNPRIEGQPIYTPTPDAPHEIPGLRMDDEQYIVQSGDTLGQIADQFGISVEEIAAVNNLTNINILSVGQVLTIPAIEPGVVGPGFKIIPDSELVASPVTSYFDLQQFVNQHNGYLLRYSEDIEGETLTGLQIVERVTTEFSINPRILLAVLEYQSGWVTTATPREETLKYPIGVRETWREGLYLQLSWAADNLNRGYYWWRVNAVSTWALTDGSIIPVNPTINAGTAGIQYFFSKLYGREIWERSILEDGLFSVYNNLFGYPFDYTFEPVLPPGLTQPPMQLPFEKGVMWAFTGGPHGGWGDGSGWAALDFAPFVDAVGCVESDYWVVAAADGLIVRAENGAVVQDLDSDGREQTGWTILYMHIETRDRVSVGTYVTAGERVGHPSCEGGFSSGTHMHIARRFNGEWIPADQDLPFNLDGWISSGTGNEYDGYLTKESATIEAWDRNVPENAIQR